MFRVDDLCDHQTRKNNNSEYSLHSFRSLGDKKTLLEAASASMNGNAMMTVILFLKVRTS
jgi:hypothetical protein